MPSHRLLTEGVTLVLDHTDMHTPGGVYQWIHEVSKALKENRLTKEQMVDAAFLLREIAERFDDIRKAANKATDLAGRIVAAKSLADVNEENVGKVKGQFATGWVEDGVNTNIPKRDSAEFAQLMEYLGVTETGARLLSVNWRRLGEVLTVMTAEGKPMPPGLRDQVIYSCPQLRVVKHRGLDLNSFKE